MATPVHKGTETPIALVVDNTTSLIIVLIPTVYNQLLPVRSQREELHIW